MMRTFISANLSSNSDTTVTGEFLTLLQLSESVVDTIKTEWIAGKIYFLNKKMWYNNELKWELAIPHFFSFSAFKRILKNQVANYQ